jgi:heme exporter protein C
VALVASALYLKTGALKYDAFAAGVTEVAVAFASVNLASGMIWARYAWGIWWAWDARLTSMLTCWLIYAGYLILRRAVDEPTQRAKLSAFLSIFGCVDVAFVYKSIEWFRTQHPAPVLSLRQGGGMGPGMEAPIYWNWLAMACFATVLIIVRMRQEGVSREIDSLRRMAHSY